MLREQVLGSGSDRSGSADSLRNATRARCCDQSPISSSAHPASNVPSLELFCVATLRGLHSCVNICSNWSSSFLSLRSTRISWIHTEPAEPEFERLSDGPGMLHEEHLRFGLNPASASSRGSAQLDAASHVDLRGSGSLHGAVKESAVRKPFWEV